MSGERLANIAQQLYQARRAARLFGGDQYAEKILPFMELIDRASEGASPLIGGIKMAQAMQDAGLDSACLWLFAATVELCEPDEHTPALAAEKGKVVA